MKRILLILSVIRSGGLVSLAMIAVLVADTSAVLMPPGRDLETLSLLNAGGLILGCAVLACLRRSN